MQKTASSLKMKHVCWMKGDLQMFVLLAWQRDTDQELCRRQLCKSRSSGDLRAMC